MTNQPGRDTSAVLVHDYLNQYGGAERVVEAIHSIYEESPVYTSMFDPNAMPPAYREWDIHTTWVDRVPQSHRRHQLLLPLYAPSFQHLELPQCDVVLSSSSAFGKFAAPPPGAIHICYTHAPARFAWNFEQYCERERLPAAVRAVLRPYMWWFRRHDRVQARRVDYFIANSTVVRDRIRAFWRRDAEVIYPPVDTHRFEPAGPSEIENYFLVVSRLVPYKRIDIVIDAFRVLGLPLLVAGDGRDRERLQARASPNIQFLGRVSDEELRALSARCRAAIFMSEDDFGIAQVEIQAAGRPVIALARGGVLDSVRPDVTGIWVKDRTVGALVEAVRRFDTLRFDPDVLVAHAERFSLQRFQDEYRSFVEERVERYRAEGQSHWS
ncbi:MAG: glycosyltransferase [Chloroflexota bacterium]